MLMGKALRGNEKLFFNSILSARLRFILNLIFDFVYHVKEARLACCLAKSDHKIRL